MKLGSFRTFSALFASFRIFSSVTALFALYTHPFTVDVKQQCNNNKITWLLSFAIIFPVSLMDSSSLRKFKVLFKPARSWKFFTIGVIRMNGNITSFQRDSIRKGSVNFILFYSNHRHLTFLGSQ